MSPQRAVVVLGLVAISSAACDDAAAPAALADRGDPGAGRAAVDEHGCTACHRIPGGSGHDSFVGPPLDAWSERSFIAGSLPNSAANLERWLADPQAVRPGSAMPDLDLTEKEIDDIVAFLFTLD